MRERGETEKKFSEANRDRHRRQYLDCNGAGGQMRRYPGPARVTTANFLLLHAQVYSRQVKKETHTDTTQIDRKWRKQKAWKQSRPCSRDALSSST